jgi:hypothetical protein
MNNFLSHPKARKFPARSDGELDQRRGILDVLPEKNSTFSAPY